MHNCRVSERVYVVFLPMNVPFPTLKSVYRRYRCCFHLYISFPSVSFPSVGFVIIGMFRFRLTLYKSFNLSGVLVLMDRHPFAMTRQTRIRLYLRGVLVRFQQCVCSWLRPCTCRSEVSQTMLFNLLPGH